MNKNKRQEILERDEHTCQFCEMTNEEHEEEYGRGIEVHHVVPKKANGSDKKQNLLTVCRSCHATLEKTQGNLLKRLYNNQNEDEIQELEHEVERLEEELEDRYTFDQIKNAADDCYTSAKIYLVTSYGLGSDKPTYEYVGHDREKALNKLEENGNRNLKKWIVDIDLASVLTKNHSDIMKRIDNDWV